MTDHASEARWLVDGKNQPASTYDLHNPEADRMIAEAQVHATLAIAEQLRLANLIAITTNEQTSGVRYTADMHALADPTREDQS